MRKFIGLLVALATIFFASDISYGSIREHRRVMKCHDIIKDNWGNKKKIERFIVCAGKVWKAPGYPRYWVSIAKCESGLYRYAYNPSGPYVGVWQHIYSSWDGRVDKYIKPLEFNNVHWSNPEVNTIVAMRMAHAHGDWSQWGCG